MSFCLLTIVITRYISAVNIALNNGKKHLAKGCLHFIYPQICMNTPSKYDHFCGEKIRLTGACEKDFALRLKCAQARNSSERKNYEHGGNVSSSGPYRCYWGFWANLAMLAWYGGPLTEQHPTLLVTSHVEKQSQKTCTIDTCIVGLRVLRAGKNWRCSERSSWVSVINCLSVPTVFSCFSFFHIFTHFPLLI